MDGNIMAARNGLITLSMNSIAPQIFMSTLIKTGGPRRIRTGARDVVSFCTFSLMGPLINLLNRPRDRRSGNPEIPGNLRCRKAKLCGCPVGDRSPGLTRFGASAAALHLPGVDLPFATFLINEMKHGIGGPRLYLPALRLFRFPEYRHDECTASEDSLIPFLRCTMLSERGHLRPSPETADKASPHEMR